MVNWNAAETVGLAGGKGGTVAGNGEQEEGRCRRTPAFVPKDSPGNLSSEHLAQQKFAVFACIQGNAGLFGFRHGTVHC